MLTEHFRQLKVECVLQVILELECLDSTSNSVKWFTDLNPWAQKLVWMTLSVSYDSNMYGYMISSHSTRRMI